MTTLEVLRAAKARLEGGEPFNFMSYPTCTCGHIYAAAEGRLAQPGEAMWATTGPYADAIEQVARALGWTTDRRTAPGFVSDATIKAAGSPGSGAAIKREHAIAVITEAITVIEAEQEQNRLDVLAQARRVVDAVNLDEQVVA